MNIVFILPGVVAELCHDPYVSIEQVPSLIKMETRPKGKANMKDCYQDQIFTKTNTYTQKYILSSCKSFRVLNHQTSKVNLKQSTDRFHC